MFLSQLLINLRYRTARRDLSDRYELHRTLLCAFPEDLPADERVLYRVEQRPRLPYVTILVQSQMLPDWKKAERLNDPRYLCKLPEVRAVEPQVSKGLRLPFRLQANPIVKRDGKRHAIYADDKLTRWLQRKGEAHGFAIDPLNIRSAKLGKQHGKKRKQTWHLVQFDGALEVTDPVSFVAGLRNGIGSAKAFGCGLLSVPYPA
ncbi:MAG: type I-E CRISPR-associated protein Cas6/Cse3/CasE [Chloroflexi bacterium]|nr:type I-E CRISPR-associated protein Cas6/Cse3/CasE [Chloroflexota bacterium]